MFEHLVSGRLAFHQFSSFMITKLLQVVARQVFVVVFDAKILHAQDVRNLWILVQHLQHLRFAVANVINAGPKFLAVP